MRKGGMEGEGTIRLIFISSVSIGMLVLYFFRSLVTVNVYGLLFDSDHSLATISSYAGC